MPPGLDDPGRCRLGRVAAGNHRRAHPAVGRRAELADHRAGPRRGSTVAAIPDAAGGWARALGPLQFIPSTWRQWAADGDGDGRADPQDLDDAALAAAHYLCASGGDLSTGAGWSAAIYSYNHSAAYVRSVYAAAQAYAARAS